MNIKEKMMESMMGNMSSEEKREMMDKMMESFFSGMSDEEKKEMMQDMMPKMMQSMMGGGGMSGMMGMMMGHKQDNGNEEDGESAFKPFDMCKEMMASIKQGHKTATLATPEVQGLFEDWAQQIEEEILAFQEGKESLDAEQLVEQFKISKESVYYFLTRLAQKGKLRLNISPV